MVTRNYEITVIADASLTDEECQGVFAKFRGILTDAGGAVKFESKWGRRRLAYEINKQRFGVYHLFFAEANGEVVEEFERQCGYDENVLKFFLVGVDDLEAAHKEFEALKENPTKNANLVSEIIGA